MSAWGAKRENKSCTSRALSSRLGAFARRSRRSFTSFTEGPFFGALPVSFVTTCARRQWARVSNWQRACRRCAPRQAHLLHVLQEHAPALFAPVDQAAVRISPLVGADGERDNLRKRSLLQVEHLALLVNLGAKCRGTGQCTCQNASRQHTRVGTPSLAECKPATSENQPAARRARATQSRRTHLGHQQAVD